MGEDFFAVILELVARAAVDRIDAVVTAPVGAPLGFVGAFDNENDVANVARNGAEPVVILWGVSGIPAEQFDDGAEGALGAEERTAEGLVERGIVKAVAVFAEEDGVDEHGVGREIVDEDGAGELGVGDGF